MWDFPDYDEIISKYEKQLEELREKYVQNKLDVKYDLEEIKKDNFDRNWDDIITRIGDYIHALEEERSGAEENMVPDGDYDEAFNSGHFAECDTEFWSLLQDLSSQKGWE